MQQIRFSWPEMIYVFGTFHGLLLAIYLLIGKSRHNANPLLSLLLVLFSFYLFENALYSAGYLIYYPHLIFTSLPLVYLLAPLFYLYVRKYTNPETRPRFRDLLHLAPFLFELAILMPFYILPAEAKIRIYQFAINGNYSFQFNIYFVGYLVYVISSLVYIHLALRKINTIKPVGESRAKWIRQVGIAFFSYMLFSLILSLVAFSHSPLRDLSFHANLIVQTLLIQVLGYIPFVNPQAFSRFSKNEKKYAQSGLDSEILEKHRTTLLHIMELEKPYLDAEITPEFLAEKIEITKHQLSQLLTSNFETNFYDFVNKYRIEKAKQLLHDTNYERAKIIHIALDCGFSNKSTFLRSFRKFTGLTPSEYRKQSNNLVSFN